MKNLIFISGPQGGGKTTLVNLLSGPDILVPKLKTKSPKLDLKDETVRARLKIASRALENFEYLKLAKEDKSKVIIGNRCIYDCIAFKEVYLKRGWISPNEGEVLDYLAQNLFSVMGLQNPRAIILNPGYEVVKRHLEERWKSKGEKWREKDTEYISLACKEYESLRQKENIYYIDHEIDLKDRNEIENIKSWLYQQSL